MTTVSSASNSAQQSTTFNPSGLLQSLGIGSGIDIKALAQNLVDATSKPRSEVIQKSIDKQKARTNAYDIISKAISQLQDDLMKLSQPSLFSQFKTESSNSSAVTIGATVGAQPGTHTINVNKLAQAQRTVIKGVSGYPLKAGIQSDENPLNFEFQFNGTTHNISVSDTSPEGIVSAINGQGLEIKASTVNLTGGAGGELAIVLSGEVGGSNNFNIISDSANISIALNQSAQNAVFNVDGIEFTRSSNQVNDIIEGVTINLLGSGLGNDVVVSLSNNTDNIKENLQNLMNGYNDLQNIIDVTLDPNSNMENLGGALVGDQSIQIIRDKVRAIVMPSSGSSNSGIDVSGSSTLQSFRQLGIIIDTDSKMKFAHLAEQDINNNLLKIGDDSTLNYQLTKNLKEVQLMFLGTNDKAGIASDMANALVGRGAYVDSNAVPSCPITIISTLKIGASNRIQEQQRRLTDLQLRMQTLMERYMQQFSVMDNLVGQNKSIMKNLEASFANMNQK